MNVLEGNPEESASQFRRALQQLARLGENVQVPYALLGLAVSRGEGEDLERLAVLHGAADALVESRSTPWQLVEATVREKSMMTLRQEMGEGAFDDAFPEAVRCPFPMP